MIGAGYVVVDYVGMLIVNAFEDNLHQLDHRPVRDCFHVVRIGSGDNIRLAPGAQGIVQSDIYTKFYKPHLLLDKDQF